MKKHYKVLGLENGASKQEIQDAYDKLSIELDPKNNDNLDFFKEEFNLLQKAYEKLMGQVPESINKESSDKNTDSVENTSGAITNKIFNDGEKGSNWSTEWNVCPIRKDGGSDFGYKASKGYDPVYGLGTPNIGLMMEWLNNHT